MSISERDVWLDIHVSTANSTKAKCKFDSFG
jgi:hypothetical protein